MNRENLLIVADSDHDANMLYAVRMFVPDPFIYFRLHGKCHIVISDLEIDRARQQARHCRVHSLVQCQKRLEKKDYGKPGLPQVIRLLMREARLKKIFVPHSFPLGLARDLGKLKIKVKVKPGSFFPTREFKTAEEVKKVSASLMMAEVGLAEAIQALKNSKIDRKRRLIYHHVPLTSEKLRSIIDTAILQAGGVASHTIVAGGKQGCDPHESGHGILRAHEPIILDVFPRSQKTGYFGDITRTVVKGRAAPALRQIYHTVEKAQELAFEQIRNKVRGRDVHEKVQAFFVDQGYKTGRIKGRMQGFFHGTGHGLGLEIHEAPRISATSNDILRSGHVVTVEPGLYYNDLGGVRLEDVVLVTGNGPRNLTKFEKVLEV